MVLSKSKDAKDAYNLVKKLQKRFVEKLNKLSETFGENKKFEEVKWLRDEGIHGGGSRFEARDIYHLFNTASVNVSQVHYDDMKDKRLQSASAISTIIHPKNPHVPSIHIHISLTQIRDEKPYWRIMADLNPSIPYKEDKEQFDKVLEELSGEYFQEGKQQGDKYFNIPALNKYRGISHFYLENFKTKNKKNDKDFAKKFGEGIIDAYIDIVNNALKTRHKFSVKDMQQQLTYHTLYLFQVLTLDRGTTSGLLIHDQNDAGIMGSLPKFVDKKLLASWENKLEKPQDKLVKNISKAINDKNLIDEETKIKLANVVREHYKKYPKALEMQASGNTIPSTVSNHNNK
jgi:coproporphyrinogen III oxidase